MCLPGRSVLVPQAGDALAEQGVQILFPPPGRDRDNTMPEVTSPSSLSWAAVARCILFPGRGELFASGHSSLAPHELHSTGA